jgi:hypothetical protein
MPITVTPIENLGRARDRADRTARGLAAERHFLVEGTRDTAEAIARPEIPRPGAAYGAAWPTAVVDSVRGEAYAESAVLVTVSYADPERQVGGGANPAPEGPVSNFTELTVSSIGVSVEWGWAEAGSAPPDDAEVPDAGPLSGISREVGRVSIKLTTYASEGQILARINKAVALATEGAVNLGALTLPKLRGTSITWSLQPGQAKFKGVEGPVKRLGPDDSAWYELVYTLDLAEDFLVTQYEQDEDGTPVSAQRVHIDVWRDFAGLW